MNIVESFALSTGLRIDKPDLYCASFPLPFQEKYIVITTSTGVTSKNFPHWGWVLHLIKPALKKLGFKTVQVGGEKDETVNADVDLRGITNLHQMFGIIRGSACVLAGDTSVIHVAGAFNIPIVSVFSISHPSTSGAFFGDKEKHTYILPPYLNGRPSYHPGESPAVVSKVKPEEVANAFLKLFSQPETEFKTIYYGEHYLNTTLITTPDQIVSPQFMPNCALNIRYDLGGTEEKVLQQISLRKSQLVTNKPVSIPHLSSVCGNLISLLYVIDESHNLDFAKDIKKAGIPFKMVSLKSQEMIDSLKHLYFDLGVIERKVLITEAPVTVSSKTKFLTKKFFHEGGKIYLSRAHAKIGKSIDSENKNSDYIVDDPLFWEDVSFAYLYEN